MQVPTAARQPFWVGAALMMTAGSLGLPPEHPVYWVPNKDQGDYAWPIFGGTPGRNMVNTVEQNIPRDWCIQGGKRQNIKWTAELGARSAGSPVIALGKVFVATADYKRGVPKKQGRQAALMAFRESDGQLLWQIAHEVPAHWPGAFTGTFPSTPAVADGKLYYLTFAGEVICADADKGRIQWRYDMARHLGVFPYQDGCQAYVAPPWSSPLVVGDHVFLSTGNGIDDEGTLQFPQAPSFVALDRRTGKLVWQSNLPGRNLSEGAWSSPAYSNHGGRPQVIFAGGDGVIYSFAPETGALLWECDCVPERKKLADVETECQFIGTPVVVGDRLYVGMGVTRFRHGPRHTYFLCLDITKQGDVSLRCFEASDPANKKSALVWAFGGPVNPQPKRGRKFDFQGTRSTTAVHQGLIYITEDLGYVHCLDAGTGRQLWVYDLEAEILGSPYLVDGRVFVGTQDEEVVIFHHGGAAKIRAKIDMEDAVETTPVAANGTLYITTRSKLYAIAGQ
jgi:outer membrane protein assembly factor BamB